MPNHAMLNKIAKLPRPIIHLTNALQKFHFLIISKTAYKKQYQNFKSSRERLILRPFTLLLKPKNDDRYIIVICSDKFLTTKALYKFE